MNSGLSYLLRKRPVGWARFVRRRLRGAKGVLLAVGMAVFLALVIGPQIMAMQERSAAAEAVAAGFRLWGAPALMLMALLGMSSGAGLHFRQNEIDFLLPAPISRRELLLYHVIGRLLVAMLSALWVAIFVLRWAPLWYAGLLGIFFAFAFLQLTSQAASLALSTCSVRLTQRLRRLALPALLVLVAVGLLVMLPRLPATANLGDALRALADSTAVRVAAAPAAPFVELFVSATPAQCAAWAAAALGVLVVLFALIVAFDVAYTEGAVRASREVQERLRRMRAGGGTIAATGPGRARLSLPPAPWLGGAGPIAWRQGIEALRHARGFVVTSLFTVGMPTLLVLLSVSAEGWERGEAAPLALVVVMMMTVVMNQQLALDFRRDLDRMAYLKSLPLPPRSIALGQILPGIAIFTLLQAAAIVVLVAAVGVEMPWPWPLLLLLVPFNWLSLALDNVLFLLLPYRFVPKEAGNMQFMGRTMLVMFAKLFALMVAVGVAALAGWLAWIAAGKSLAALACAVGVVLVVEAMVATWLLGAVFARFDVTVDVPG